MLWLSLAICAISDMVLKHASDNNLPSHVWITFLMWGSNAWVWYYLYKTDKFLVLTAYYMFYTALKDIGISQLMVGESLSGREWTGIFLAFLGVCVMHSK